MSDHIHPRNVDPSTFPGAFADACPECGQTVVATDAGIGRCGPCVTRSRAPQGTAMRMFEPAPTQLAGRLGLTV